MKVIFMSNSLFLSFSFTLSCSLFLNLQMTLEDMIIDSTNMSMSQYELVKYCANRMEMKVVVPRVKSGMKQTQSLLRRTFDAPDMLKLLQMCEDKKSGRFELVSFVG